MQRLVIHTYYLMQILMAVMGLIQIELALGGFVELLHFELWWTEALKSSLIVSLVITMEKRTKLMTTLYLPQLAFDILFLASRSVLVDWIVLVAGFTQFLYVILKLRRQEREERKIDMRTAYRPEWFRYWNRSCIGHVGETL